MSRRPRVTLVLEKGKDEEAIPIVFHRLLDDFEEGDPFHFLQSEVIRYHASVEDTSLKGRIAAIRSIPLVQALSHEKYPISDELILALLEEHMIRSILKMDLRCHEINKVFSDFDVDMPKIKSVKELKKEKDIVDETTSKIISRHYRQTTVHLHPDRHDEKFRKEFDALQVAYEILKDAKSRGDYIDTMLEVIKTFKNANAEVDLSDDGFQSVSRRDYGISQDSPWISADSEKHAITCSAEPLKGTSQLQQILRFANTSFLVDFMKMKEQQNSDWRKYRQKRGKKTQLLLETKIFAQPPKALRIDVLGASEKEMMGTTDCRVKLPPLYENNGFHYQGLCRAVSVYAVSNTPGDADILLLKLAGKSLDKAWDVDDSGWITANIKLPDFGTWSLYWFATVAVATETKKTVDTPMSSMTEIHCDISQEFESRTAMSQMISRAKQSCSSIRSTLNRWETSRKRFHTMKFDRKLCELEQIHMQMEHHITKGHSTADRLMEGLEHLGSEEQAAISLQKELTELDLILTKAKSVKDQILEQLQMYQKRQSMKGFKNVVADMLKQGDLARWIQSTEESEVSRLGGSGNRLYQLLIEGMTAQPEQMEVLLNAATRTDLFSEKQCRSFRDRAKELEQASGIGKIELIGRSISNLSKAATLKNDNPEILQQESIVPLGTTVAIQGLKQRADFNGVLGKFLGPSDNGRYNILVKGNIFALRRENFIIASPINNEALKATLLKIALEGIDDVPRIEQLRRPNSSGIVETDSSRQWTSTSEHRKSRKFTKRNVAGKIKHSRHPTGKSESPYGKEESLWLPKAHFPAFIGRKGENIHAIASKSKTRMFVDLQSENTDGHVELRIEGNTKTINDAKRRVQSFLRKLGDSHKMILYSDTEPPSVETKKITTSTVISSTKSGAPMTDTNVVCMENTPKDSKTRFAGAPRSAFAEVLFSPPAVGQKTRDDTSVKENSAASPSLRGETPTTVPESIDISNQVEEASVVTQPMGSAYITATKTLYSSPCRFPQTSADVRNSIDSLFLFLRQHSSCLKQSPESFYHFLQSKDVQDLDDLNAAISDSYFFLEIQSDWLKRFKVDTFIAAAVKVSHDFSLGLGFDSIPNGFRGFQNPSSPEAEAMQLPSVLAHAGKEKREFTSVFMQGWN